jgi:hypothetical protein
MFIAAVAAAIENGVLLVPEATLAMMATITMAAGVAGIAVPTLVAIAVGSDHLPRTGAYHG